jgi:hypothetical protein
VQRIVDEPERPASDKEAGEDVVSGRRQAGSGTEQATDGSGPALSAPAAQEHVEHSTLVVDEAAPAESARRIRDRAAVRRQTGRRTDRDNTRHPDIHVTDLYQC